MIDLLKEQLAYKPVIHGEVAKTPFVVCGGMGGSAFPAHIARFLGASPYIISHRDYGLPQRLPEHASYVAISYSGDTAETLSFAKEALERRLPLSVIASGGALIALAKEQGLPFVEVPAGLVPREAVVSLTNAFLALLGEQNLLNPDAAPECDFEAAEREGETVASAIENAIPLIYASTRNEVLAYLSKILCNETAKAPAFANVLPELDHNELQGFDVREREQLTAPLIALFLKDESDDERIRHRMDLTRKILTDNGVRTMELDLPNETRASTFLYAWWLMRAAVRSLAKRYGVDPNDTPLIASLKQNL